jgi:hypothetical protein
LGTLHLSKTKNMLFSGLKRLGSLEAVRMELTDAMVGKECARFISKAKIIDSLSNQKILIPDDSQYFRNHSGEVKFFENKIVTSKNGFIHIPENAKYISFPHFRNRGGHLIYGEPHFYYN